MAVAYLSPVTGEIDGIRQSPWSLGSVRGGVGARSKLHIRQLDKADQFKLILRASPIYPSLSENPRVLPRILANGCQPVSSASVTSAKPQTCSMRSFFGLDSWNPAVLFPGLRNCPQTGRAAGLLAAEPSGDGPVAEGGGRGRRQSPVGY